MRRIRCGTAPGAVSRAITWVIVALGLSWLTWPVWGSLTAPDRETVAAETPALLFALAGLVVLLAWGVWYDCGCHAPALAPVTLLVVVDSAVRMLLSPGSSGVEPTFALPLLAGATLGGPAGFLTGALAAMTSSIPLGLVQSPLVGQTLVWGLWGLTGGGLRSLRTRTAWFVGVLVCLPLGIVSGLLLNLIGWTGETAATTGAFLPGLPPLASATRLWEYTWATSFAYDASRAITNAALLLLVGLPLLHGMRAAWGVAPGPTDQPARNPRVSSAARERRARSSTLNQLWNLDEGGTE